MRRVKRIGCFNILFYKRLHHKISAVSFAVRSEVAWALGEIGDSRAVNPLLRLAIQEWSNKGSINRNSAINALGAIWYYDDNPPKNL